MEIIYDYTEDGLRLPGVLYESNNKDVCVLFIHGMGGNVINSYFANVWANIFMKKDISFLFGHTRGSSHIHDLFTKNMTYERYGVIYEKFDESIYDIDLWTKKLEELGYKNIFLIGHSLGCNKVINYLAKKSNNIRGLILASPPDIVGLITSKKFQPNYKEMLEEAKENVKANSPKKILSSLLWDEYLISSQTFLDFANTDGEINNLPISQNPVHFKSLEKVDIPILAFLGEKDDIIINSLEKDLEIIKSKALSCPMFDTKIFKDANHTYDNCEEEIGNYICNWILKIQLKK